ncbi:glycosyltransferase family 39 protein [Micromonospora coxensis]|uniref:glycosyltransferase family 39 protein n=1 Tax=Micromonospora coxensis TaxID=356852 RepID=UPI001E455EEA|nr:glycosyltransferase family 39 protein [Micromonospora coxensis]
MWLVPTLATLAAGLVGIGHAQPWRDELASWSAATRSLPDLFRLTGTVDAATGPYYLLLHGWVRLAGDSPAALRLPSALAMAAAAGLTAVLGRRLFGARAGLLAGLLLAVLPGTSRYAQEARPYALATLFAVLATLLLVRALDRPGRARWAGYAAAVAALGLTHLLALTLLAAHAVVVLAARRAGAPATPGNSAGVGHAGGAPATQGDTGEAAAGVGDTGEAAAGVGDAGEAAAGVGDAGGASATAGAARAGEGDTGEAAAGVGDAGGASATAGAARAGEGDTGEAPATTGDTRYRRLPLYWVLALLPVLVVLTPLLLRARGQRSRQLDWVEAARLTDLAALPGGVAQSSVVGGLLVGLAALGAARAGRRALLPGLCVLLPVLLVFVGGLVVPLWVPRYLLFIVPFACVLAGAALIAAPARPATAPPWQASAPSGAAPGSPSAAPGRPPAAPDATPAPALAARRWQLLAPPVAVVALAGLLGLPEQASLRQTHGWPRSATVDYRGAAEIIGAGQEPGDTIVYWPRDGWLFLDLGVSYHLKERPRDVLALRDQRQRADFWVTECPRPADCLAGARRVWLVVAGRRPDPLTVVPTATGDALRDAYTVTRRWHRPNLTVALLTRD